jgi:hypothetical protein
VGGQEATAGDRGSGPGEQGAARPGAPGGGQPPPGRQGRIAAGTALAGVVAAGVALAAVLLRPSGALLGKSGGPLDSTAAVVLLVLAVFGGMLVLSARYRGSVGYQQNLPPFEQRLSDAARVVMIVAAVAVPAMLLAMHSFPGASDDTPPQEVRVTSGADRSPPPYKPPKTGEPHDGSSLHLPHWLVDVAVAALVLVLLFAGYQLWRHLRPGGSAETPGAYGGLQDDQDVLADAVDSGRRALLLGDDPRAAVIACYAAMEASLAGSGVARRASDSPQDLLERASAGGLLDGPHAEDLTRLFREARYSTHPMDTGHRDRAAAALDAIAAQLAARAAERAAREAQGAPPAAPDGPGPQRTAGADR